jgi:outer membrane protein assembly factor BamB
LGNATANARGIIATAHRHFAHAVDLYDPATQRVRSIADFLNNDQVGYHAPLRVEAGTSGDFFAVDQNRNRVLRIDADGKVVKEYPIKKEGEKESPTDFRVCEKNRSFYWLTGRTVRCTDFDGKVRWTVEAGVSAHPDEGNSGGWDVDDDGNLYVLGQLGTAIRKLSAEGKASGEITLQMGELRPTEATRVSCLRVFGGDAVVQRSHDTELFQCYDLATGARKVVVSASHARVTIRIPSLVWTAGDKVPVVIEYFDTVSKNAPRWRVWVSPFGVADWRELLLADGGVAVPEGLAGLYHLRFSAETGLRGAAGKSELVLHEAVEVRHPGSKGTVNILTPGSQAFWRQGEAIPITLNVRAAVKDLPTSVALSVGEGRAVLARADVPLPKGGPAQLTLPASLTRKLRPGRYELRAEAPKLTPGTQTLVIGPALQGASSLRMVQYGDYDWTCPLGGVWDHADLVASHVQRSAKLGINLFVDRDGAPAFRRDLKWETDAQVQLGALAARLSQDPVGVSPEKARLLPPFKQTLAAYHAAGIGQMAILTYMDAGLPPGTGHDPRKPDQLEADLVAVTKSLSPFPAFRGWTWASNWWVGEPAAETARALGKEQAYEAALKRARESGVWDQVLDEVGDRRIRYAVEAQERYKRTLRDAAPGLVTASSGPYRNVTCYPPATFGNVDEVDLHYQAEQLQPPNTFPHNVDYQKRPGKPAWGHPELWNDSGTGDQILPTLWSMVMRGADGVGCSGRIPQWDYPSRDPRDSLLGVPSVFRSFGDAIKPLGPWLARLQGNDRVALIVSPRMVKIDDWVGIGGRYFNRLFEAYQSCLYAHVPAVFVFPEDLAPEGLAKFKAVVVVGQEVELEQPLAEALRRAKSAGAAVFADGTCRRQPALDAAPLGVRFDHVEKDPSVWQDDSAYWRFPDYFRANARLLIKTLGKAVSPEAQVDNPEVLLSERASGEARFLFVVNNTSCPLPPGQLWRVTLGVATRMPVRTPIRLDAKNRFIYDVLASRRIEPAADGSVQADLRTTPARVYAVLPQEVRGIRLHGPAGVRAGESFHWRVVVEDSEGQPVRAPVPVRLRVIDKQGAAVDEWFACADADGASGVLALPVNLPADLTLEASEFLTGRVVRLPLRVAKATLPMRLADDGAGTSKERAAPLERQAVGKEADAELPVPEESFGPHLRSVAVTAGGRLAVVSAMNWGDNLYAVDTETGKVQWQRRVGHYFGIDAQPFADGVAVQGFDFNTPQGYHLYLADEAGSLRRRFALYGLPQRGPHEFVAGMLRDHPNNFAVSPAADWVASAGDLGLAVWDVNGKELWRLDWWKERPRTLRLAAQGAKSLLVMEGMTVTSFGASDGKVRWSKRLAPDGEIVGARVGRDGRECAFLGSTASGRVFLLREGEVVNTLAAPGDELDLSPDAGHLAVTGGGTVSVYTASGGLVWSFHGDDRLHQPRFSPDGGRLVVASELGSVYVLGLDGQLQFETDMKALAAPAWLGDRDLLLATWRGEILRLDGQYGVKWRVRAVPGGADDLRPHLLAADRTPTAHVSGWENAQTPPDRRPSANLLKPSSVSLRVFDKGRALDWQMDPRKLMDGKLDAPEGPWLPWRTLYPIGGGGEPLALTLDWFHTRMHVTGITLVEDRAHPESWVRNAVLESWDVASEKWVHVQRLLSDSPSHYHRLAKPVETSRLRLVLPRGFCGNLYLAELIVYGEALGCSHPDVVAKHPVAVLFDERESDVTAMYNPKLGLSVSSESPYAGKLCIRMEGDKMAGPEFQAPFGHRLPNWDFEIAQNPKPGQYRYIQFAWKALSPDTKGISLGVGGDNAGPVVFHTGVPSPFEEAKLNKIAGTPLPEWQVVTFDLWEAFRKPTRLGTLVLGTVGGPAAFDRILLGRTRKDLMNPPDK